MAFIIHPLNVLKEIASLRARDKSSVLEIEVRILAIGSHIPIDFSAKKLQNEREELLKTHHLRLKVRVSPFILYFDAFFQFDF